MKLSNKILIGGFFLPIVLTVVGILFLSVNSSSDERFHISVKEWQKSTIY